MDPITGGLISGGLKLLGGLLGGDDEPTQLSPRDSMLSQAQGARDAASQYGFNPLTMLQYGQTNGASGKSGAGGLASNELLLGAVRDVADIASGEQSRRRAAEDLQNDLTKIRIEQARDGIVQIQDRAVDRVGSGPAVLGTRAATFSQSNVASRDPYAEKKSHIREDVKTDGDRIQPTVGYDWDELVSGFVLNEYGKGKLRTRVNRLNGAFAPIGNGGLPKFTPSATTPIPQISTRPKNRRGALGDGSSVSRNDKPSWGFQPSWMFGL